MNENSVVTNICDGCLSKDRVLTSFSYEFLYLYSQLLGTPLNMKTINMCWECCAVLRKVERFKKQIKKAQNCMLDLVENHSLSKLKQTKCLKIDYSSHEIESKDFKTEDESLYKSLGMQDFSNHNITHNFYNNNGFNSETDLHRNNDVKCEFFSHNNYETEFDYVDADCTDVFYSVDEKIVKTLEEFDESDEEPLRNKKIKTKEKMKKETKRREKASGVVMNARVMKKLQQLNVNGDHLEMVLLSWEEVESERQATLQNPKFMRHAHKCHQCALGFNHACKLEEHMKKHQPCEGSVECDSCHIQCKDKQALASHRRRHRVRWRCVVCGGCWSRASVAADHVHRHHAGPTPTHTCNMCGHRDTTLGKLRNHIKKAHSGQHKCELCDKVFRDKTSLRKHLFIHSGVKEYSCSECGKQFLFKKAMEIHLVTHQSPAYMYCYQCDMTFKNQMSYNQHMKYNLKHIDPDKLKYACKLCDKKFVKAKRLEEHNMAVHLKITHIQCPVTGCTFACSSRAVLRSHRRAIHAQHVTSRNHVCDMCGKAYTTKKSLEGHLRMHSGERPFRCTKCPAAFGYESALYNHNKLVHLKHKVNRSRAQPNSNWIEVPTD
ncbi:unnamed protein product [Pieris macdunnoughi]|uniref:C2H2-type domain-containing protein n=1 Tax=Pieris macdunnoughi TaxID=345717 RepID=A0A821VS10_9NEOP|nr:unnamed protein product [Pieris macdunnoughi]